MMCYFAQIFEKQHNINLLSNKRASIKLATAAEKIRKILSANNDAALNLEYITEDYDLNAIITRETFESLSRELVNRIYKNCKIALERARVQSVHSVEILGGSSRIPIVQHIYAKAFDVQNINKTLNPEEAISRGCAINAAMICSLFIVKEFVVNDIIYYPLKYYYTYDINSRNDVYEEVCLLFEENSCLLEKKVLQTIQKKPFFVVVLNEICGIRTNFYIENEKESMIKLYFFIDQNGLLKLKKAKKIEENHDINESNEIVKNEKITDILVIEHNEHILMDQDAIIQAINDEKVFMQQDRIIKEALDKRNELESYLYESKTGFSSYLAEYTTVESLNFIKCQLDSIEN